MKLDPHANFDVAATGEATRHIERPSPLFGSARRLGKGALALTGTIAMLWASNAVEAFAGSGSSATEGPIAASVEGNLMAPDLPPPELTVDPTAYSGPSVGVATDSWNDDGLGKHTLFKDMAAEGMTEARLNVLVSSSPPRLRAVRAEIDSALANGITPVINLQQEMNATPVDYPEEAAQIAAELPQVQDFDIGDEWNSPYFSDLNVGQVVRLTALTNQYIHEVRPDAETRGFALASGFNSLGFLSQIVSIADSKYGSMLNVADELDIHLYHSLIKDLAILEASEQIYQEGYIDIGELGFKVGPKDSSGLISQSQQALNELGIITAVSQDPRIKSVLLFRFRANRQDPFDTANVAASGLKRPSFYALQSQLTNR